MPPTQVSSLQRTLLSSACLLTFCTIGQPAFAVESNQASKADPLKTFHLVDPIVVTGSRSLKHLSDSENTIDVVDTTDINHIDSYTIAGSLEDIPNVDITEGYNPISQRISIRGANDKQTTFLIDGARQDYSTMAGNGSTALQIDPSMVKQIEVRKGASSSLYGDRGIGGVVAVTTKSVNDLLPADRNFGAHIAGSTNSALHGRQYGVWGYGRKNNWSVIVGANHRTSHDVKDSLGKIDTAKYHSNSGLFKIGYELNPNTKAELGVFYDENHYAQTKSYSEYREHQLRLVLKGDHRWNDSFSSSLNLQFTQKNNRTDEIIDSPFYVTAQTSPDKTKDKYHSINGSLVNTIKGHWLGNHEASVGLDFSFEHQQGMGFGPLRSGVEVNTSFVEDPSRPNAKATDIGLFVQDDWSIIPYLRLTPSIRFTSYHRHVIRGNGSNTSDSALTPSLIVSLQPVKPLTLWAGYHEGFRAPVMDELYFSYPDKLQKYAVIVPNPNLKPEKLRGIEVGAKWRSKGFLDEDYLQISASIFNERLKDAISPKRWVNKFVRYAQTQNIARAKKIGGELSIRYLYKGLDTQLSYGKIRMTDLQTHKVDTSITPSSIHWKIGYHYTPWNIYPWYRFNWYEGNKQYDTESPYAGKSFSTSSIGLDWHPKFGHGHGLNVEFAVHNLFGKKYVHANDYTGLARSYILRVTGIF